MSNIESVIVDYTNLTDEEQIKLWLDLFHFADTVLPSGKELKVFVKTKKCLLSNKINKRGVTNG